jgi:hypothetical protein
MFVMTHDTIKITNLYKLLENKGNCSGVSCNACFLLDENMRCSITDDDEVIKYINKKLIQLKLGLI